ncbi:POT family proton-dependent oligopeptide transporter [Methylobacter tundripaludum]|uniref:POT family proton-dependent oligopeptide transporter n=1 Tax=Methylobacter tundripaludum TaxID=173365 RepID=A0A2S6H009_9GAMM|nr:POT family MFS transporter [Methylobacter tundripaludum]PPK70798.1 POT family proton-dependent oligopeptide transporter [Methylobacter tundripaludum]
MKTPYRTAPVPSTEIPSGIPFIIGNELAERFSYYGMRAILVVFMTQYLMDAGGNLAPMSDSEAKAYFHLFVSITYFTPFFGALLADGLLGKYRTIILLSTVYCLGHFCLALDDTRTGLLVGQSLIALGAGGIKPCVSAHVGDQFGASNQHWLSKVFSWFYLSLNFGAFISMLLVPWLLKTYGASVAFLLPGVLMLLATVVFWSGRHRFVHIPAAGMGFVREALSGEGLRCLGRLSGIYLFIAMFWALFDQNGSSWVLQSQQMDRIVFGVEILPSQIQAANPLLIVLLTPLFYRFLYPALGRYLHLGYLNKIAIGLFITVLSFVLIAAIQMRIDAGFHPGIGWQLLAYLLLTSAEVMVSITCLEFSYTQAPRSMKSLVMSLYMAAVALGNLFTSAVNFFIENPDGSSRLAGADYFWFFAALMLATALGFVWHSRNYREKTYLQDET